MWPQLLDDVEPRLSGVAIADALAHLRPTRIRLDLGRSTLREAIWALPAIDSISLRFPSCAVAVAATPVAARLIASHLGPRAAPDGGEPAQLHIDLAPSALRAARLDGDRLAVPSAPFPARRQHASAHRIDGARTAGFDPADEAPSLRLDPAARAGARRSARGGPLVALLAGHRRARWPHLDEARRLVERHLGATFLVPSPRDDPEATASLLSLCAVCIADDTGWGHVAAAVGAPVVMVHGPTSPDWSGPASPDGVSLFTTRCTCPPPRPRGARCLACLDAQRVAAVAERLAADRWPWDRLRRLLPL